MTSAVTQVEWLSKDEAAKRLNISTRRVLEYASAGALQSTKFRNPATHHWQVKLHAGDVEKLRDERMLPQTAAARGRLALTTSTPNETGLAKHAAEVAARSSPRPWLTLHQAEEYTGLPESALLALIGSGALPALDVGVRPGGKWRVKRTDLDGIEGRRFTPVLERE
jgi:excisionase family DNA binding protein